MKIPSSFQSDTGANIASFFAAAVVTAVIIGGQISLANRYDAQAGAVLADQPAAGLMAMATTPAKATLR